MTSIWHYLFLPHPLNNHKAKLLHHKSLLMYIFLFIASQVMISFLAFNNPSVLGLATNINTDELLLYVNQKRAENGLAELNLNSSLNKAAALKAQDMFSKNYWAHFAPDGTTPWYFIDQTGYAYKYAGENLARDFAVSKQVVDAWMNSTTHKKNLLDTRFQDVGFAVVNGKISGEETTLVVQMFGARTAGNIARLPTDSGNQKAFSIESDEQVNTNPQIKQAQTTRITAPIPSDSVVKQPIFNSFNVSKKLSIAMGIFLIALLYLDMALVIKKKVYRISGNNFAHIIFILFLIFSLFWVKYGIII